MSYSLIIDNFLINCTQAIDKITKYIPKNVSGETNEALMRPITQEELAQAFKDTPINKFPRPDGFKTNLFDHCRDMIREEFWEIIEDSRSSGNVL